MLVAINYLAFAKCLAIDEYVMDENLPNMTNMSSSNNFVIGNYSSGNLIFSKTK